MHGPVITQTIVTKGKRISFQFRSIQERLVNSKCFPMDYMEIKKIKWDGQLSFINSDKPEGRVTNYI